MAHTCFGVVTRDQGNAAVDAVKDSIAANKPFAIVFIEISFSSGIDGIEAARQIRELDRNINIVIVSGAVVSEEDNLSAQIPPADKVFFFRKPFHDVECRQLAAALCGKWHADTALRQANEDLEVRVEKRTKALQKLAYFDIVTRMPNQLLLLEKLKGMIAESESKPGDSVVVLIDIDRFSFVNETMGYDAGTELLRAIGNRLGRTFMESNRYKKSIVGRFGADEFALLVPGVEDEDVIRKIAERVKQTVEAPFLIGGRDLFLKASIGVAWHPVHGRDAKSVFRCAEAALHSSMRSLNNTITYYHNQMRYRARYKFDLEAEFRVALDSGDITTHYQPQQCTASGKIRGVEALARWIRPDGSAVPPADFIPLSEEMGASDALFETVLRCVCSDIAGWRETHNWDIPVSVNLSAHQLRNVNLVNVVKGILAAAGIDRHLVNLELTESVLLEDLSVAQPILDDLAAYGIGVHIDDFGTGYSSLSYLAQLPVQTIKIDQAFIANLSDSDANNRVVEAIVALGKAMQLDVVAEGVETQAQYAIVRRLGCDLVQGHFVARPMESQALLTWVDGFEDTMSFKKQSTVIDIDSKR